MMMMMMMMMIIIIIIYRNYSRSDKTSATCSTWIALRSSLKDLENLIKSASIKLKFRLFILNVGTCNTSQIGELFHTYGIFHSTLRVFA